MPVLPRWPPPSSSGCHGTHSRPNNIRLGTFISCLQVSGQKGVTLEASPAVEQRTMVCYTWKRPKPRAHIPLNSHWMDHQFAFCCWTWRLPTVTHTTWHRRGSWSGKMKRFLWWKHLTFANFMKIHNHENTLLRLLPAWSISFLS